MSIKNAYLNEVYQGLAKRNAEQKEFLQAVEEVLESLEPVVEAHPEYEKASLIERLVEPERIITVPFVPCGLGWTTGRTDARLESSRPDRCAVSTLPSAPTKAACASILLSTCLSSSSWALSSASRTA